MRQEFLAPDDCAERALYLLTEIGQFENLIRVSSEERPMTNSRAMNLALLGGRPAGPVEQPTYPYFTARTYRRAMQIMREGRVLGLSRHVPEVREAEEALSRYHGGQHVMTTSSGHASLHMSLAGLNIAEGDEVITTPYSYGASTSCILHQNAIPIFADVDKVTGLIDPKQIEARITRRTRAILIVHVFGHPVDMTTIMRIAQRHGLKVIEDCSQAHGATWKGVGIGNFGHASGFSCMGGKQLGTTEAGYMVTPDEDVYWRACLNSQHLGRDVDAGFPDELRPFVDSLVYTYRITTIDAMLLAEQLKKLGKEVEARRQNIATLRELLVDSKYLAWPKCSKHGRTSYYIWSMNFRSKRAGIHRDTFLKAVQAEGLMMNNHILSPIPMWPRLQWRTYRGPRTTWQENLRRAKVIYRKEDVPNCQYKVEHGAQMLFRFYKPAKATMRRIADVIYKVEANIDALREYERMTE